MLLACRAWLIAGISLTGTCCMCAGMTLTLVLLKGLPTRGAAAAYGSYMMVSLATGLLNSWPAPACTNPVFSGQSSHIQGLCSCSSFAIILPSFFLSHALSCLQRCSMAAATCVFLDTIQ